MPATRQSASEPAAKILQLLRKKEYYTVELLDSLSRHSNLTYAQIKEAIWELLLQTKIDFTSDQKLSLHPDLAAGRLHRGRRQHA